MTLLITSPRICIYENTSLPLLSIRMLTWHLQVAMGWDLLNDMDDNVSFFLLLLDLAAYSYLAPIFLPPPLLRYLLCPLYPLRKFNIVFLLI